MPPFCQRACALSLRRAANDLRVARMSTHRDSVFTPSLTNAPFMMLEHVNLNVGNRDIAKLFYIDILGAGEDTRTEEILQVVPGATGLLWANLGLQQFHLPIDASGEAQTWRGSIHIDYPCQKSLQELEARLQAAQIHLLRTQLQWTWDMDHRRLQVTCPWGNKFVLTAQSDLGIEPGWYSPEGVLTSTTVSGHPCLNTPVGLGIRELHCHVAKGTAAGIARFYRRFFGTTVDIVELGRGLSACSIAMGVHQQLQFIETDGDLPDYDGHHICVYISSFDEVYLRFKKHNMVYENPRFPTLTYETLERAQELNEFRIINIVDPDSPDTVLTKLEHEIRHPLHFAFPMKELLSLV